MLKRWKMKSQMIKQKNHNPPAPEKALLTHWCRYFPF